MNQTEQEFQTHSDLLDAELEKASREIDGDRAKMAEDFALRSLASAPRPPWIGSVGQVDETLWAEANRRPVAYVEYDGKEWPQDLGNIHSYKGFRPLSDQVLVRPLPAQDRISSSSLIVIPGNHDRGRLDNKLGVVLAIGPGDPVADKCERCGHSGNMRLEVLKRHNVEPSENNSGWYFRCFDCDGTGFTGKVDRTPFEVQVGDTVLYAPRGWAEIELDNEKLIVLHDCQTILAVVDPDTVLFTEDPTTKKKGPDWAK